MIENISDTAYLVAAYRALETERSDALFQDPFAKRLVGERGMKIVDSLRSGRRSSWFLVARTCILDQWIQKIIREENIDTVLNLAAGLDARAYRLELPQALRWFDIDLPSISNHKETTLKNDKPKCDYHLVKLDLANQEERARFFSEVARDSKKTLIVSEGFLMYLTPIQAIELAQELAQHSPFRFWLAELLGPVQLALIKFKWGRQFKAANSEMAFAPKEGPQFFSRYGWQPVDFKSSFDEAIRIGRAPTGAPLLKGATRLLPRNLRTMINSAGIALLKR
ncbi:MAG: class I SAM-dependent methyltransferase [Proteobacteria bacterium]|nr:class I SAM-dependent methyltransferase [Pseudomonadota bacterium]